ncbi:MAG: DUF4382 domain-containing protein [Thermodesulfovibrionales bacterium]|nr:DUF4382 domain-containing protein [Thermodesulfovibrionales bacterium]MDP3111550.1 DUF4382 domain-containing protein [Thermodesulfovibrionales bacterium]
MMEKTAKIKLFLLFSAVAVAVVILAKVYMSATSPSSVKLTVYKIELMTGASDTNPQVFFSNDTGLEIDLAKGIDAVIGQAQIPAGTYKRIRMTVTNGIKLSIAKAGDNPCGGAAFTDRVIPIAGDGTDPNSQVQINFAAYDDKGGTWRGSQITHLMLGHVTVNENQGTQVKLRFNTADTLFCSSGAVEMRAPWSVSVLPGAL